ncbi:16S rRNA (adenine1518-N6/adenine1519-N6)-dimethyltransferase [Promicromonospora umidemergens]|uniref:Ribosomal RNA small subunit methyltransferase A n=1 Tax=Promicromonospora umidemergens TaxID=629679 RepID=A0ABP8WEG2_9MICO|nr:16S rRNA (adenine(1518)-N(6)/adenine(1519)-N(6))-dimethyltransferase RsmA [Promicromonospora umidemergens]MCP2284324.1 16S rRNA (adenine1518-N6/adenine1519-N6)-dimethyltransferase [Promicromonospora umidemergens]
MNETSNALLGPAEIRDLAGRLGVRPTKTLGQNFLHDGGTVRKIVRIAALRPGERVVEVGPGLGSLTLGLVEAGASVVAIEIDPLLAGQITGTVQDRFPGADFEVVLSDAMDVTTLPGAPPTALVANLPYNVAVPVLLTMLQRFDSLERVLVMVQAEVADRIAAVPGSKIYGIPSVKAAWYSSARRVGTIGRNVFWPAPNVDSALVYLERREPPSTTAPRERVFAVVDTAFAQRRKTLRAALAGLFGSGAAAETALRAAGVDPSARGETLVVEQFARIAEQLGQPGEGVA